MLFKDNNELLAAAAGFIGLIALLWQIHGPQRKAVKIAATLLVLGGIGWFLILSRAMDRDVERIQDAARAATLDRAIISERQRQRDSITALAEARRQVRQEEAERAVADSTRRVNEARVQLAIRSIADSAAREQRRRAMQDTLRARLVGTWSEVSSTRPGGAKPTLALLIRADGQIERASLSNNMLTARFDIPINVGLTYTLTSDTSADFRFKAPIASYGGPAVLRRDGTLIWEMVMASQRWVTTYRTRPN